MTRRGARFRTVLTVLSAWSVLAGAALAGAAPAGAVPKAVRIAPGIEYTRFDIEASKGLTRAHVLSVDLSSRQVGVGLLYPGKVASRATVSRLATSAGAVAGVNGDFFNISEAQHPGVTATGASVGPAIAQGRALKAAVPNGQRFGPALPPGTTTRDVLGVTADGHARLDSITLDGSVTTVGGVRPLGGLNQYALPVGSVGAFTSDWGTVSRLRSVCGTDTDRAAPCGDDTTEVVVRDGRVVSTADAPGSGAIASGTTVLVGREAGAQWLRKLSTGDSVTVRHRLVASATESPYDFALGGYPVLRGGRPLPGLDDSTSAVRTAAGIAAEGRKLLLLALDGSAAYRTGLTIAEVAATLRDLGSTDALSLDGGGSSTLVARAPGADAVTVRNHPSAGEERPVPNGIGVFTKP
ncbi:phosphodiester glycosidase family protein [Streptomyces sp. NPDC002643]